MDNMDCTSMKCPKCLQTNVVPIKYGYPSEKMQLEYYDGKIKLGGCEMSEDNPNYHCNACNYQWQKGKRNEGHYSVI